MNDITSPIMKKILKNPLVVFTLENKELETLSPHEWTLLVVLYDKCLYKCKKVDQFSGAMWHSILIKHPHLSEVCDWSKLHKKQIEHLTSLYPDMIRYCIAFV